MDWLRDHVVQCRHGKGVSAIHRHNVERNVLYKMGRELGLDVAQEPHFLVRARVQRDADRSYLSGFEEGKGPLAWTSSVPLFYRLNPPNPTHTQYTTLLRLGDSGGPSL